MKQNNNPYPVDVRLRVDLHQTNSTSFRLDTECNRTTDSKIQRGLDSKKKKLVSRSTCNMLTPFPSNPPHFQSVGILSQLLRPLPSGLVYKEPAGVQTSQRGVGCEMHLAISGNSPRVSIRWHPKYVVKVLVRGHTRTRLP
jgi:hypothetical protein